MFKSFVTDKNHIILVLHFRRCCSGCRIPSHSNPFTHSFPQRPSLSHLATLQTILNIYKYASSNKTIFPALYLSFKSTPAATLFTPFPLICNCMMHHDVTNASFCTATKFKKSINILLRVQLSNSLYLWYQIILT